MSTFAQKIENLIGSVDNTTLITDSIQQVGEEIIGIAPVEKLNNISLTIVIPAESGETPSVGISVHDKKVLGASKAGYSARIINAEEKTRYLDTGSIYRASDTTPVYYISNDSMFIIGSNGLETSGTLRFVPKTPVSTASLVVIDSGDSATYGFPKEAERLLILGAACRCLQKLMTDSRTSLPVDLSSPAISSLSINVIIPIAPVTPNFTAITMDNFTINTFQAYSNASAGVAGTHASSVDDDDANWSNMLAGISPPSYFKPTTAGTSFPTAEIDWTMPSLPISPTIDWTAIVQIVQDIILPAGIVLPSLDIDEPEVTTWDFPTAPVQPELDFTGITQTISALVLPHDIVEPVFAFTDPEDLTWDFPSVPVTPTLDYGDLESWITAEDPEMAQVRINAIQATISSHQSSASAYQTQVNAIVARNQGIISTWGDEWKTRAQVYQTELSTLVSAYQGQSQGKQAIIQAQVNARNSQVEEVLSRARATVQMYQAKISVYQAQVNGIIQQNQAIIQTWSTEWQTRTAKFTSELNALVKKYSTEADGTGKQSAAQIAVRGQQLQEASERAKTELSIYQGRMQAYQTEVQAITQKNSGVATNWQKENAGLLQQYQLDIQNELNSFNKDNAAYQKEADARLLWYQSQARKGTTSRSGGAAMAGVSPKGEAQASSTQNVAKAQLRFQRELQDYTLRLSIFNGDLQRFQAEVGKEIKVYATNLQKDIQSWNAGLQNYSAKLQKHGADYKLKQGQLAQLYQEYQLGLQLFITGRVDMRNPEQQRRR